MFRQSVTGHVLLWLKSLLLQYDSSVFYNLILHWANAVRSTFQQSAIHRWFVTESRFKKLYADSFFYGVAASFVQACMRMLQKLYARITAYNQNSINHCITDAFAKTGYFRFETVSAVFFALMLLVPHESWNNLYAFLGACALGVLYLFGLAKGRAFATNVRVLTVSLLAFTVSVVCGILITPVHADGLRIALLIFASVLFMLFTAGGITDAKRLSTFISTLLGALFVICLYAIYQRITGVEVSLEFTDVLTNEGMPGRVFATLSNPNNFAEVVVLLLPFVYAMFINAPKKRIKAAWVVVFGVCMAALMMSYSRSCYVAFAIATLVFILLYDWRLLIPLAVLAVACIPLLPETVTNRILTIGSMSDTSNSYRIYVWEGVLRLLRQHGITGIGLGPEAFSRTYPGFAHPFATTAPHAHMLYLELFVELGILGGLGFFVYLLSAIKSGLATYNRTDKQLRCIILAAISSIAGISFVCAAEYIWFYPRVMFVFWIVLGILLAAIRLSKKQNGGIEK